jgi:hypothetical protein
MPVLQGVGHPETVAIVSKRAINRLLNEADRLQTEVRIAPRLNQTNGGYDGLAEPDVGTPDVQQLAARFIVFNDLKPKAHRVEIACEKSLVSQRFKIRQRAPLQYQIPFWNPNLPNPRVQSLVYLLALGFHSSARRCASEI